MVNFTEFLNCTLGGNASLGLEYSHCLDDVPAYEDCPDPSVCEESRLGSQHVGLAFGLTVGAGLATTLGALLPLVPFVRQKNTRFLAGAMALAAGVMLYVSFTEIRTKSLNSFCCVAPDHFDALTTGCFFAGILLTALLDLLVWLLQRLDCGCGGGCCRSGRLMVKRVTFSTGGGSGGQDSREDSIQQRKGGRGGEGEDRFSAMDDTASVSGGGWRGGRRGGATRGKVRLHAVNNASNLSELSLDASALILPDRYDNDRSTTASDNSSSSSSNTPRAQSLEEGCDVAREVVEETRETVFVESTGREAETARATTAGLAEDENSSIQHSQTPTGVFSYTYIISIVPVHLPYKSAIHVHTY